jgi:hypothetical protein
MQRWERRARNWLIRAQERRMRRKARLTNEGELSMANARVEEAFRSEEPTEAIVLSNKEAVLGTEDVRIEISA